MLSIFCCTALRKVSWYLFLFSATAGASMAPRMYSVMAQLSGSVVDGTDTSQSVYYGNKFSLEALYLVRGGPTFGFRYFFEARNENSAQSGQAYGPMAGYYTDKGFFILVTYDILAKLGNWTNGEGFQVDLGYIEHLGNQIHLGGKISARKIKYKSDRTNSLAVEKNVQDTFPSLVLTYLF